MKIKTLKFHFLPQSFKIYIQAHQSFSAKYESHYSRLGRNDRGKDVRDARKPHHPQTFMEAKLSHIPRTRHTSDNVSRLPTEKTERKPLQLGTSPAISILSKSCSGGDLSTSLGVFTILGK